MPYSNGRYSIYDDYQLSNSKAIPLFVGDAGRESLAVAQYNQGLYDTALAGSMGIDESLNNLVYLPQDEVLANELSTTMRGQLSEMAEKGDYENMLPQVQQLGRRFATRYQQLSAPVQQYQNWAKSLDEKDLNLTSSMKDRFKAMALSEYKGLGKDFRGSFQGITPDKNIDVNKLVDDTVKGIAEHIQASDISYVNGKWIVTRGGKTTDVESDRVQSLLNSALKNSEDYQAYSRMMGRLEGFATTQRITSPDQVPDTNPYKKRAMEYAQTHGVTFQQALRDLVDNDTQVGIYANAQNYAKQKFVKHNVETSSGVKGANDYALAEYQHQFELDAAQNPYMVQGPNIKLSDDEKDPRKIRDANNTLTIDSRNLDSKIRGLENRLNSGGLSVAAREQLNNELTTAKDQQAQTNAKLARNGMITGYTQNKAAQELGYNDYNDYIQKRAAPVTEAVKRLYPSGIGTAKGGKLTPEEIAEAIVTKDAKVEFNVAAGTSTLKIKGVVMPSTFKGYDDILRMMGKVDNDDTSKRFEKKWQEVHKSSAEDVSLQNEVIGITKADADKIKPALQAGAGGLKFTEPGQFKQEEAPQDFDVLGISPVGKDNEVILQVQGYEVGDNGKRVPTKVYDVHATNSNIGEILSDQWSVAGTPEARRAANMIRANSGARLVQSSSPGTRIKISDIEGGVFAKKSISGGEVNYALYDSSGNIMTGNPAREDGKFITSSSAAIGEWIDLFKGEYKDEPRIVPGQRQDTDKNTGTKRKIQ